MTQGLPSGYTEWHAVEFPKVRRHMWAKKSRISFAFFSHFDLMLCQVKRVKELRTAQRIERVVYPRYHERIFVQSLAIQLSVVYTEPPGAIFLADQQDVGRMICWSRAG